MHSGFKLQLSCSYQVQEKLVQTRSGIEGKDFYFYGDLYKLNSSVYLNDAKKFFLRLWLKGNIIF